MGAAAPLPAAQPPATRPAHWFPLALFGVLIAVSVLVERAPLPRGWAAYGAYGTTSLSSSGYGSTFFVSFHMRGVLPGAGGGWYWAAVLTAGFLLTAGWYRRSARRSGIPGPGRGYLITGLVLTAAAAVVPVVLARHASIPALIWLTGPWAGATFAIPVIAVALGMLARRTRSRVIAAAALAFLAAALLAGWPAIRDAWAAFTYRGGNPVPALIAMGPQPPFGYAAILLPALVLLAAAAATFLRPLRTREPA